MKNFEHFIRYQLPAIAWGAAMFIVSSIPGSKLPSFSRVLNDKILHASEYFIFGLLIYRAFEPKKNKNRFSWYRLVLPLVIIILFAISDEYHQGFVAGRTEDILDALADTIGGVMSALVIYIIERRRKLRPNEF